MRKVLITLASILAVVGIILLNALTFSTRYARMMETSITVTSADNSFIGKKMKEFFAREDLEEKLARELDTLPLFPTHPEYEEELASLIVSLGRDASLEQVRCQGPPLLRRLPRPPPAAQGGISIMERPLERKPSGKQALIHHQQGQLPHPPPPIHRLGRKIGRW